MYVYVYFLYSIINNKHFYLASPLPLWPVWELKKGGGVE